MLRRRARSSRLVPAIVVAVLRVSSLLSAQESRIPMAAAAPLLLHPRGLNAVVAAAALEAHHRLGDAGCRQMFSEFRDASGQPLQRRLDALGQTPQSYLGWLWFVDGGVQGRCERPDVVAFTTPGSQVVRYCGDRFTRSLAKRGLGFLAAIVIHEELHALGLGENPPSSDEITRRVESACGS
jgi:hypothetical protein